MGASTNLVVLFWGPYKAEKAIVLVGIMFGTNFLPHHTPFGASGNNRRSWQGPWQTPRHIGPGTANVGVSFGSFSEPFTGGWSVGG